jgi:hypothetical protein
VICQRIQMPDGGTAIVCRDGRRKRCAICGALAAEKLCDGPPPRAARRKTCDRALCSRCATHVEGADLDFCPEHKELAMQPRGGPPRPVGDLIPKLPDAGEGPLNAGQEDVCGDVRPQPGSDGNKAPLERPTAPIHEPHVCRSCTAPIFWAQVLELDEDGRWSRVKNETTGRMKAMPVDSQPDPLKGNVVLFHREGEGIVCRVLKRGEQPPPGATLRTSHFATCPNASKHRRRR